MNFLDIKPIGDDSLDCFGDLIASIAAWWNLNYELMFVESWCFNFQPIVSSASSLLSQQISGPERMPLKNLERYHGLKLKMHQNLSANKVFNIINKELVSEKPSILIIDDFWCPWVSSEYQRNHGYHTVLLIGIEEETKEIYCIDPFYSKSIEKLTYSDFSRGCNDCVTINRVNKTIINVDWRIIVQNAVIKINKNNTFQKMKAFGNVIPNKLDITGETIGYQNPAFSPLFQVLTSISLGRKEFAKSLEYLGKLWNITDLLVKAEQLREAGYKWESIRALVTKVYFVPNKLEILTKIAKKVIDLADFEENIAKELLQLTDRKDVIVTSGIKNEIQEEFQKKKYNKIVYLDIKEMFNNKGFTSLSSTEFSEGLDGLGACFLADNLPKDEIWTIDDFKFYIPHFNDKVYDNISCNGQTIKVPAGKYSQIHILGCAEFGNFSELMGIRYQGEEINQIPLRFSDFWKPNPCFGETIVWVGNSCRKSKNGTELLTHQVRLFAQCYFLISDKELSEIHLPDCPNIHIFGITLRSV